MVLVSKKVHLYMAPPGKKSQDAAAKFFGIAKKFMELWCTQVKHKQPLSGGSRHRFDNCSAVR